MVVAILHSEDGYYVYKSKRPAVEVALNTSNGRAALEVSCGSGRLSGYRTGWFKLSGSEKDSTVFHRFPEFSRETHTYGLLLWHLQVACKHIVIRSPDLRDLVLNKKGEITSQLSGRKITLKSLKSPKSQWWPITEGRFMSNSPLSPIKQQFNIHPDGYVHVRLGCDGGGDTGYMLYRLSEKKGTRCYELTPVPSRPSVQHLLESFKKACPSIWSKDNNYMNQLKNVRLENEDVMYGIGIFGNIQERLYRRRRLI
ncbi:hypothetical protein FOZ63_020634 [Perkinsus olseni]|uniref:Uncharacterized protein n=1 Tax=Perkinsus olseni TaxID=32597 RepID=A0A7J6N493_PEROL|nr:hypothetical protein FOZ60_016237 [Perkinsus olseni]KAF4739069.1 hypothetical protein FOZ62_020225 [Perkinsus olseni]KAF4752996.1 hypothetical protein FOZ63_020634 [Perkinsus olseni]